VRPPQSSNALSGRSVCIVAGVDEVTASLVEGDDDAPGIADAVAEHTGGAVEVIVRPRVVVGVDQLADQLAADPSLLEGADVLLVSVAAELARDRHGADLEHHVTTGLERVVASCKARGVRVFACNLSTFDPGTETFRYDDKPEPRALRAHRLNAVLVAISMLDGISIVDIDRVIGRFGAGAGVEALGQYTAAGRREVVTEVVRVLDDYGFFDDRPLLEQLGQRTQGR
jgi:hypothetical protein